MALKLNFQLDILLIFDFYKKLGNYKKNINICLISISGLFQIKNGKNININMTGLGIPNLDKDKLRLVLY